MNSKRSSSKKHSRLAIVLSHPIQYYAPWFRHIASSKLVTIHVFYLWDAGMSVTTDRNFGKTFSWDIPLLDGYEWEMVPNASSDPGTHHFSGLDNPGLVERLADWKPDAILLFGYAWKSHLRVLLSPRLRNVPLLFRGDSHDLSPTRGIKQRLMASAKSLLFRRFDHFLAVGQANQEFLLKHGVPSARISICPHCVDNHRFRESTETAIQQAHEWKAELGISPERPVAVFAGKFEDKKRPLDLLEAFLSLKISDVPSRKSPALLLVGNGHLETALRVRAAKHLDHSIFIAPFQNQTQMPKVYAMADVLVLPSFGNGETWGLVVNEAMNLGVPAIVSSHVGCGRDLVIDGETGWCFPAGEIDALATCLTDAYACPEKTRVIGDNARSHITDWSYERATEVLILALDKLLNQ